MDLFPELWRLVARALRSDAEWSKHGQLLALGQVNRAAHKGVEWYLREDVPELWATRFWARRMAQPQWLAKVHGPAHALWNGCAPWHTVSRSELVQEDGAVSHLWLLLVFELIPRPAGRLLWLMLRLRLASEVADVSTMSISVFVTVTHWFKTYRGPLGRSTTALSP
jgi:hypothetical protein